MGQSWSCVYVIYFFMPVIDYYSFMVKFMFMSVPRLGFV